MPIDIALLSSHAFLDPVVIMPSDQPATQCVTFLTII